MTATMPASSLHSFCCGALIPRATPKSSCGGRVASFALQIPALLLGLVLSAGLIVLLPVMIVSVIIVEWLADRRR